MTRTVREKAIGLLTKAVSDYSGNEKKIADSLLEELNIWLKGGIPDEDATVVVVKNV